MRESFYYTIDNITKNGIRYNYWVPKTSYVLLPSHPHSFYLHLEPWVHLFHWVSTILPHISCIVFTSPSLLFPLMTYNIYRDIANNFPYSIRKSNINKGNILYNILYKKESILIMNLRHFPKRLSLLYKLETSWQNVLTNKTTYNLFYNKDLPACSKVST